LLSESQDFDSADAEGLDYLFGPALGGLSARQAHFRRIHESCRVRMLPAIIAGGLFDEFRKAVLFEAPGIRSESIPTPKTQDDRELYHALFDASCQFGYILIPNDIKRRGCTAINNPNYLTAMDWLTHENVIVRYLAVAWLYQARAPAAVPKILVLVDEPCLAYNPWIEQVCRSVRSSFEFFPMLKGIRQCDPWSLAVAGARRDVSLVPEIIWTLEEPGRKNTENLVWTLGEIRSRDAIPALQRQLLGGSYWAQADAAEALGKIGDPAVLAFLLEVLETATAWAKWHILIAIGQLGTVNEIPLLEKYAGSQERFGSPESFDHKVNVQGAAQRAILEIKRRQYSNE